MHSCKSHILAPWVRYTLQCVQSMTIQYGSLNTLSAYHSDKNSELNHQREQYENLKWKLERKLKELDGELALQRQVEHP